MGLADEWKKDFGTDEGLGSQWKSDFETNPMEPAPAIPEQPGTAPSGGLGAQWQQEIGGTPEGPAPAPVSELAPFESDFEFWPAAVKGVKQVGSMIGDVAKSAEEVAGQLTEQFVPDSIKKSPLYMPIKYSTKGAISRLLPANALLNKMSKEGAFDPDREYEARAKNKDEYTKIAEEFVAVGPQMIINMAANVIGGFPGTMMAAGQQIYGGQYSGYRADGHTPIEAAGLALVDTAQQAPIEALSTIFVMGGPKILKPLIKTKYGKKAYDVALKTIKTKGVNWLYQMSNSIAGRLGIGAFTEGVEEYVQSLSEVTTAVLSRLVKGKPLPTWDEFYANKDSIVSQKHKEGKHAAIIGALWGLTGAGVGVGLDKLSGADKPVDLLDDTPPPTPETVDTRADANAILESAIANLESQPVIPEYPAGVTALPPDLPPGQGPAIAEQPQGAVAEPGLQQMKIVYSEQPAGGPVIIGKDTGAVTEETLAREPAAAGLTAQERFPGNIWEMQGSTEQAEVPKATKIASDLKDAAENVNPNPTKSQIESGRYEKGHINWEGFKIGIETAKGMIRKGVDRLGKAWSQKMNVDYGYVEGVKGADGERLDIAFRRSKNPKDYQKVFVIDQLDPATGKFDEHKVYVGYAGKKQAKLGYLSNYEKGWKGFGKVTEMTVPAFKKFLKRMDPKKAAAGQELITKEEWLADPGVRPEGYTKYEYMKGVEGRPMATATNDTVEAEYETWAEKTGQPKPRPRVYSDRPTIQQVTARVQAIKQDVMQGDLKEIKATDTPSDVMDEFLAAEMLCKAMGINLVIVDAGDVDIAMNGLWMPSLDAILLNSKNPNPVMTVLSHEITHSMIKKNPVLYEALRNYIFANHAEGSYARWEADYISMIESHGREVPPRKIREHEYVAYTVGIVSTKDAFWNEMAKKNPTLFKQVTDFILSTMTRIRNMTGRYIAKYSKEWSEEISKYKPDEPARGYIELNNIDQAAIDIAEIFARAAKENDQNAMVKGFEAQRDAWEEESQDAADIEEIAAPKKKVKAYKLFRTLKSRPGELFPLFIGKSEAVPIGKWIAAKFLPTKGFAQRPGWHAGNMPRADHLLKKDGTLADDRVWAEVELPDDVDWQKKADANKSKDIKDEIPKGGLYRFARTKFQGAEWMIAGSLKVNKILTAAEVKIINLENMPLTELEKVPVEDRARAQLGPDAKESEVKRLADTIRSVQEKGKKKAGGIEADIEAGDFKDWFSGSKVVDAEGRPLVVYHSTQNQFKTFEKTSDIGYHFGTSEQAEQRYGEAKQQIKKGMDTGRTIPAYLRIKNPLSMRDVLNFDSAGDLMAALLDDGIITQQENNELAKWDNDHALDKIKRLLKEKGYDGAVYENRVEGAGESWIAFESNQIKSIFNKEWDKQTPLFDIEVSEKDDANTIALNAISGLADGKTIITIDDKKVGARPIIESIGFVRQGKSNKYKFDERVPKDADIIAGMYQAAWHVDLKTKGTTKKLFGQIAERLGRIQREGLGEKEQSDDQKKLRNYLNESRLTYREAAEATDRGNQLPTKNVLVRPKGVESGKGRQLLVQISSDFRAEEASHIGDPYYEALYEKRQGYNRPSRDFWELPEWMTRLAYFMPKADVYVVRSMEEAKAFLNQAEYDNVFFSVLDTNKRFVKDIAQNYKGDIIAGGYLPDGSYYKGMKNVSWMGNMEDAAKKVGVPFKNGVDYRHFKNSKTIPRLEMSRGCLHKCAFCSQERTLKMATPEQIDEQIKEFKAFDYELVYLNDKTFGQAENYTQLIEIKEKLQKANPKFKGFIIQTTAGQFLKMPTDFLNESGIIFVELGVETFNNKFLKSLKKPHTTEMIEKATKKIRDLNMVFVPNVMVGLTGKNKDGSRWVETKETYANTMAFFKRNQDIISHFNIGVLAAETGTELQKQLDDWQEVDTDEATMNRSWIKNKDVHEKYYYDLSKMGLEQLEDPNVSAYIDAVMELDVEKAAEPIPLFTKPLRDFRKKLLADVKTGAKKKMEKVAAYDGWQWDVGDRVYGKKTDAIYEIIARTWDDKNNRPMYMYKGLGSKEGQQGNFIAELAHDDLTLMTGPRLVGDTEVYAGGHGTLKVSKEEADFVDDFNLGNTHVNSLVLDAYRIATGNTENTIGPDTTFKGLRGWESELVDELEWNRDDAVEFIDDVIDRAKKATGVVGESEVLFDIEISENEGKYGTATGSLLYWNISKIAKDAGGWNKIKAYLKTIKQWNGIPITSKSINYIGNKGTELSKNAKLRNKVKAVETFRDRLSAGEIDENSKEYAAAVKKYGSDLQLFTVSRSKRFYVGTDTIYGPKQKGDITKTVKKEHSFLGPFKTELTRDKNFKLVMDTPIFSKNLETRRKEIDAIIKKNKQYAGWYEDWNSFIKAFKNLPEDKLVKYIKLMAVFSAQSGPQGNMKEFTRFVNKLEVGQEIKVGKKKDGADGIDQDQYNKIMAIWNDADPATTLEERRDAYGDKVGTYMHVGLFPHADGVVIDRHMPRLWGYDITWSPNMKFKNFNIMPQVELEIVGDIKEAAARNNISPSAVQATLWYESRIPDVVASSYRMAAAMSPSEYLPGVMHAGLRTESLGVGKHFKQTPLKKGDFLLATKRDGTIKHNSYSRDDIGKRIADHTDANPYAELVYLYEAGTDPENQLKGKPNVYEVDLNQEKIYDGITDTLGYWEFARQRLALDPFANLTNIFANLIKKTGLFDGMVVKAPVGEGRWILLFDKAEITGVPEDAVAGVSDVVKTLESNFPQTIKGISAIFNGRADKLYKKFKSLKAKYAEIKEDYFKPTVARFQGATGGKHEISGMAGIRGPLKAVRAMLAEFGVANIQNNIILVHTEEGAKRNGSFYRFKVKRSFESVEQIYRAIAKYGLEDYNISVNPIAGSFFIEQFVMDSYPQSFVDSFTKMIGDITDKGFPQNTTYRATSEVLGDPNWTGVPARALKFYKQDLIDYFGQKEGMEKYAKAIKAAQIYKGEIRKQIDSRKPGEDLSDFEEGREGRPADYGRAVKGPDVAGQFANPDLDMPDVEETPTESKADIYYSQLRAAVDSKSFPEKSSAKNYISVLEGMVKKGHIKAIELDWVGLIEWLEYNKGPMTKAKVLDFLEKNNVKIDEVIFGQDATASEAGRRHAADLILDEYIGSNNYTEDGWGELAAELELWVMEGGDVSDYADVHSFFGYNVDLVSWMQEATAEEGETEYTQYTVDEEGSPEYKEILITGYQSPQQLFAGAMEALDWYYKKEYKDDQYYKSFKNLDNEQKGRLLRKLALYKLQKAKAPAYLVTQFKKWQNSGAYQIPHWQGKGVEDVVAHLRFDEKTIDGKRTLFIEEIQSDWAQRGRKVGFIDYKKYAPVGYHFIKQIQPDKSYVVHQLVDDATGKVIAEGSMRGETLVKAGFKSGFVKQTPFRMSKDWALLVLKRAVRYAAENGYEQIAWTGGDIQVKRYENAFRKAVDEIYYNKKTGHLRGVKGGAIVFEKTLGSDAELPDYVGAANAKQLLSAKMHNEGRLKELTKKKIELYKDLKEWFKLNTEARIHEQILPMLYPGMLDYENIDWRMKGAEYADIYSYVKQSGVRMKYGKFKKELHALEAVNDFLEDGESVVGGDNIIMDSQGMKGFYDEIVPSAFKKFFGSKKKPKKKWGKPELKMQDMVVTDNVESARYVSPHYIPVAGNDHVMSGSRIAIFRNGYWREQSLAEAVQLLDSNELYNESDYDLGMMGADIKAAVIDWVQDKEIPQDYDSIADYSRDVIVPALNQRLGTTEEANKIWVSPITSEMREKATTEGFPLFDIEESEIPTKTSTVLTDKIGRKQKKLSDKIAESFRDFLDNWQTNMVDKLHPIKDWFGEKSNAYMLFRGLPGIQSTLNAFMEHGKLKMLSDGAITTEGNGQGFIPWLNGLGKDAEKFLYWQIAKRSEVLTGEDREMLLTDADRKKIYDWVGEKPENRDSWQEISDEFAEWNDNMLDMALGAGLITKEQVKGWQTEYYIPFYRIFEDEATRMEFVRGPAKGKKFISANIKRLRGSEKRMGDPMENIIKNWSALLTNSMSNTASREMFNFAADNNLKTGLIKINEETGEEEEIPLIEQIPWSKTVIFKPTGKGGPVFVQEKTGEPILAFKDGGKSVFYKVNDPELYGALSGLNKEYFNNVLMSVMSGSKRLLTLGATITPAFRIANMLRDTLHTFQISENFIPFWDTARGFMKIWNNDPEYAEFMASGHAFGGSYVRADNPNALKKYTDRLVKKEGSGVTKTLLDTTAKLWGFWEDIGEASENAARVQLYSNLKKKGVSHLEASFSARDLMDFQMSGASNVVQFFIQTVPFLNARVQGLYKMGRALADNPKTFMAKGAMISVASLALWLLYSDDDRYKELEDWEKWAYYHFWIGGVHFRIPKPFETGVIFSSSVEAAANVMSGNDEIDHVFGYLKHAMLETFAFNPVPQVIRPVAEVYMDKSFFTGRPIESPSKKRLRPGDRYDPWDSETLRLLGDKLNISPKKAKTLIRGYTASIGMGILAVSDLMVRNIADFPERPSVSIEQYPGIGRFVRGKVSRYTKHMSKFYDLYKEVDELVGTVNNYKRIGEFEKARDLTKANRRKLGMRKGLGAARKQLGNISLEMRKVWYSRTLKSSEKNARLEDLTLQRNKIVKQIYDRYLNK